jgi:hypothetical protein
MTDATARSVCVFRFRIFAYSVHGRLSQPFPGFLSQLGGAMRRATHDCNLRCDDSVNATGRLSLKISAKLVGVGAASRPWIFRGERSGLLDAHRDDGKRFVVRADEKLTAFLELRRAVRAYWELI